MIKFNYLSERCKKLSETIKKDIPLILSEIERYGKGNPTLSDSIPELLFDDEINRCSNVIRQIDNFDTTSLDRNLKSLKVTRLYGKFVRRVDADYDMIDNHMRVGYPSSISHEMLHMSSTIYDYDKGMCYSGLLMFGGELHIGREFTEGLTELLNIENFNVGDNIPSYEYFMKYVKLFREAFPKNDLVKYYSTSDLNGLLEELTSYGVSKEEGLTYIYLLGKFKPLYFKVVEGFLAEYLEDFNAKVKRIEK